MYGYTVGVSDTRISLRDGRYFDCLQKLHTISGSIVAGFAGNVLLGFSLIESLKLYLAHLPSGCGWDPEYVVKWNSTAREVWEAQKKNVPDKLRSTSLQILMAYPSTDNGIPGMAKTFLVTLRSPKFEANYTLARKWDSIGSGAYIHRDKIASLNDASSLHPAEKLEVNNPGGFGRSLATTVYFEITENPDPTVGSMLQTCLVWRKNAEVLWHHIERTEGGWSIGGQNQAPKNKVCSTLNELNTYLSNNSESSASEAVC